MRQSAPVLNYWTELFSYAKLKVLPRLSSREGFVKDTEIESIMSKLEELIYMVVERLD